MFWIDDEKLLFVIGVLTLPLAALAAIRYFGSLGEFWAAYRSTWRTPGEILEDTASDILLPGGARPRPARGDYVRVWVFGICHALAVLALYSIIHVHFPALGAALTRMW